MSMYDLATQQKVAIWRRKAVEGTLSPEEQLEAVQYLMAGRRAAFEAAAGAKTTRKASAKATASLPSGDDLLSEMLGE